MSTRVCLESSQQRQLLPLAMEGDREALGKLFTRDMRRLYRTALYIFASPEDAEDAVQDGFLSALCNLHRFEGRARFSTWLTRIVANAALMRLRRRQAHVMSLGWASQRVRRLRLDRG